MSRLRTLWMVPALAAVAALGQARPAAALETGSFLKTSVRSLSDFLAHVRRDSVLQKRYGKHLEMRWETVPGYLKEHLKPGEIKKADFFTVYNVTNWGEIYPTKQRLPAGTPIFRLDQTDTFFTTLGDPVVPFFVPVDGQSPPTVSRILAARQKPQRKPAPGSPAAASGAGATSSLLTDQPGTPVAGEKPSTGERLLGTAEKPGSATDDTVHEETVVIDTPSE